VGVSLTAGYRLGSAFSFASLSNLSLIAPACQPYEQRFLTAVLKIASREHTCCNDVMFHLTTLMTVDTVLYEYLNDDKITV
jgi:hypothetical protein